MLPHGAKIGAYQYAVMLAVTGLGIVGAPWWMALIAAVLLFGSTLFEYADVQSRAIGPASAVAGSAVLTVAAISIGFAAMCYVGGNALAGMMLK
ncbi:MAG TPA: hypothetical protein VH852_03480 [Hyphomicrobium sp.]|jgi:hypothetical protein